MMSPRCDVSPIARVSPGYVPSMLTSRLGNIIVARPGDTRGTVLARTYLSPAKMRRHQKERLVKRPKWFQAGRSVGLQYKIKI
ncbi:UNVERIFIED_CONTAM: hypothetical protein K2H54_040349 [Gekko kuhli]